MSWASGGGSTATYKVAYQSGATAPIDCASGTVVPSPTTSKAITGLTLSTQYAFRVCALNGNATPDISTGATVTGTTSGNSPVLTTVPDRSFPANFLNQGSNFSVDINNTNTGDDTNMSYTCVYDTVVDGAVASGTACTSLSGTATFNTSTGIFSWTPNTSASGPYEIKITGTDSGNASTGTRIFVIDVKPPYVTANLLGNWDAQFANLSGPYSSANSTWKDLTANTFDGNINDNTHGTWVGTGSTASPYALNFDGSANVDFGSSVLASQTKMMFTGWISPAAASTGNTVLVGNSAAATGNGFTIRQSLSHAGKLEFTVGKDYQGVVLADSPIGYWRLGDGAGTVAKDISGQGNDGTYTAGMLLNAGGGITGDADGAGTFVRANSQSVQISNAAIYQMEYTQNITMEAWIKTSNTANDQFIFAKEVNGGSAAGYYIIVYNGGAPAHKLAMLIEHDNTHYVGVIGSTTITDNAWHHVVGVNTGTGTAAGVKLYVDGNLETNTVLSDNLSSLSVLNSAPLVIGARDTTAGVPFDGYIDEVALYNTVLSAGQVTTHYNTGRGNYGGVCYSNSPFANAAWNFIGGIFDGSSANLYVNGLLECSNAVTAGFSSAATNLVGGATASNTKDWSGKLAELKVYGTSDGSAVGTSANIKTNFDATVGRYNVATTNIVTSGLVVNMDAAKAKSGGTGPYNNGCAGTDLSWYDLTATVLVGTLTNFSSCGATTGWNGNGIALGTSQTGPYRLTFNGSNYVDAGTNAAVNFEYSDTFSLESWINTSYTGSNNFILAKELNSGIFSGYYIYSRIFSGVAKFTAMLQGDNTGHVIEIYGNTTISDGVWHHVVMTNSGSGTAAGVKLYVDGTLQTMTVLTNNLASTTIKNAANLTIGSRQNGGVPFFGSIAKAAVYNTVLSQSDVTQNCNALQSRFANVVCH